MNRFCQLEAELVCLSDVCTHKLVMHLCWGCVPVPRVGKEVNDGRLRWI